MTEPAPISRADQIAAALADFPDAQFEAPGQTTPPIPEPVAAEVSPEEPTEDQATASDEGATEAKDDAAGQTATDPETAKRIAAVQKAEKRSRDLLARERDELAKLKADLENQRKEWTAQLDEARSFAALKAKARYAPAEVLTALGLTDEDLEPAAKDLYARSKAGATDPRNRDAAAKMQREREYADKVTALEKKLEDFERRDQERQQQAQYENAWKSYYGDVVKAVDTSEAPLLKSALTKNPAKTQTAIQATAAHLFQETGEWPDAQDVIVTWEKQRRQELEDLGIDLSAKKPAAESKAPKTVSPSARSSTAPQPGKRSAKEERADVLRALEEGRLE